jgi:hypothetical protein
MSAALQFVKTAPERITVRSLCTDDMSDWSEIFYKKSEKRPHKKRGKFGKICKKSNMDEQRTTVGIFFITRHC